MSSSATSRRIVSMDQFRGYTVAGMFLVNFLGGYAAIHPVLQHNDTYFSYADSIMPSFMFAVGFSFRLTYLRRRAQSSALHTIWTYVRRSLALVAVSLIMYGFGGHFKGWAEFDRMPAEFQPFRPQAPRSKSFDLLLAKAREENVGKDEAKIREAASAMGNMVNGGEPKEDQQKQPYAVSEKAAKEAIDEGQSFVEPAVERKHAWEALDWKSKFLIHWRIFGAKLFKSDLWETLAIIGVTQLVILPWIDCGFLTRFLVLVILGITHGVLSYWFNWDFVYGLNDNWMSKLWMTGSNRSWDGGFFGPLSWGVAMMGGTLAYDLVSLSASHVAAAARLILWGAVFMAVGYAMSCVTRLYELSGPEIAGMKERHLLQDAEKGWLAHVIERQEKLLRELRQKPNQSKAELVPEIDRLEGTIAVLRDQQQRYPNLELAESPVMPPWERLKGRKLKDLIVEPPFVGPPKDDQNPHVDLRPQNYWMMGKKMPNLSFITFATGFAFALYGLFVVACDIGGWRLGVFTTFGTNALAAYFLHGVVEHVAVHPLVPRDAPLWYCLAGLALFFLMTYVPVRFLEKHNIYVRL